MYCDFPYFQDRPHVPIALESDHKKARFIPLLDTGADYSVFSRADALRLNLDWEKGERKQFVNADGSEFFGKIFSLSMTIEGYVFLAKVCFLEDSQVHTCLLGRLDVFQHFDITIREKQKIVSLASTNI